MKRPLVILALFFTIIGDALGQISDQGNYCAHREEPTSDQKSALAVEFKAWIARQNNRISAEVEVWTIPVVFHVTSSNLPALATFQNAVNELNDAFANRGSFSTPQGVDTRIQFCLASTAPDGGGTTGVNHIPTDYQNTDMDLDHKELISHSKWELLAMHREMGSSSNPSAPAYWRMNSVITLGCSILGQAEIAKMTTAL
jgi:hypothetical protein